MADKTLNDVFQDTIKDIHSSEKMFLNAMPKMQEAAQNARLKEAIGKHITQTEEHVRRIEKVAQILGFEPGGVVCQATVGLIREATEHIEEYAGNAAGDAAIIACAQKNEHYEIANYGTVITWAEQLELNPEAIDLLEDTLEEEEETDDLLTGIAEDEINSAAVTG